MNLFRDAGTFLAWYGAVLGTLLRALPVTTVTLVFCSAMGKLANMLARLLPLKVILLAGAEGIPSYFRPFLAPDQKPLGLVVLILGAVVCFIADPLLDAVAGKLAEAGSRKAVEKANDIVLTDQRQKAQGDFIAITGMTAELLFAALFFVVITRIDGHLCLLIAGLLIFAFVATAFLLRPVEGEADRPLAHYIAEDTDDFLTAISVTVLVIAFLFIVWPFVATTPPLGAERTNILLAMVAITFLRRTLRSLKLATRTAVRLTARNHEVNARLFRKHLVQRRERPETRLLRQMLAGRRWQKRSQRELASITGVPASSRTRWIDPSGGVPQLAVETAQRKGELSVRIERVFPQARISRLDSEEFLFRHVSRAALMAPAVLSRFSAPPFECLALDLGQHAARFARSEWPGAHATIIETLWARPPPEALVTAYHASHAPLHSRLTRDFVARLELAVASQAEGEAIARFLGQLPEAQARLAALPLFINNRDMGRHNVWRACDGRPLLTDWGGWSIEPLGVGQLPWRGNPAELSGIITRLRGERPDIGPQLDAADILFAAKLAAIERAIEKDRYASALALLMDPQNLPDFRAAMDDEQSPELLEAEG